MKTSLILVLLISLIVGFTLGYLYNNYYVGNHTYTITVKPPAENKTVTIVEKTTSYITKTIVETSTKTITETARETETIHATVSVVKTIYIGASGFKIGLWKPIKACGLLDRSKLTSNDMLCGLSQWTALLNIALNLRVPGDPFATASRVGSWVSNHTRYVTDEEEFHVKEYVQLPTETLKRGCGDCEDLSMLTAALLLATGEYREVAIVEFSYKNISVGHVEAGFIYNKTLYIVPWTEYSYPMSIDEYASMSLDHGALVSNATVYVFKLRGGVPVLSGVFSVSKIHFMHKAVVNESVLGVVNKAVLDILSTYGFESGAPPEYLKLDAKFIASFEPSREPPIIPVDYYVIIMPIDWYGSRNSSWISWWCKLYLYKNLPDILDWLKDVYHGCIYVYSEIDKAVIEDYVYSENGSLITVYRKEPVIVVYMLAPQYYPVPRVEVSVNNTILLVKVYSSSRDVEVILYNARGEPVLGVAREGTVYSGLKTITAEEWVASGNTTLIKASYNKIASSLKPGYYELVVWVSGKIAYDAPVEIGG